MLNNVPGVGPIFQMVFGMFGNGPDLEKFYKEIIKKVEEMIKRALEDYFKRECYIKFELLGNACEEHASLTQKWYDKNGIKSYNHLGEVIPSTSSSIESDDTLTPMIHASYLDLKGKFNDAMKYFTDDKYRGHVAPLLTYTSVMYVTFLHDTLKYGKEMKFDDSILYGTANTDGIEKIKNDFINKSLSELKTSGQEYTKVVNSTLERQWLAFPPFPPGGAWIEPVPYSWVSPSGTSLAIKLFLANTNFYPDSAQLIRRNNLTFYVLEKKKMAHLIKVDEDTSPGYNKTGYLSYRFGCEQLAPGALVVINTLYTMFNNGFNRTFKLKLTHLIEREAKWRLDFYNAVVGEPDSFTKTFTFTNADSSVNPHCKPHTSVSVNEFGTFTTDKKFITLTCIRNLKEKIGYAYGSLIYAIELIDQ